MILLMDEGRVIERGTHDQLMAARGVYHEMVRRQMESDGKKGEICGPKRQITIGQCCRV